MDKFTATGAPIGRTPTREPTLFVWPRVLVVLLRLTTNKVRTRVLLSSFLTPTSFLAVLVS